MALSSGTRIGVYEITGLIGAGGMGEVYRARDHRLQRDVALKVLPSAVGQDADRLARFEREARALASLSHPNIATIHGFDDSSGAPALVMELVEGQTLADRIASGPLPVDEALTNALQIAEALESAHEQGIVHRDLKPANVKVRPDGTVKVLDFGLAKVFDASGELPAFNPSNSPTVTSPAMTRDGIILGTAAYMSPEQARGKNVDKRTDIWAFGCLLYEMLTAHPAFGGATTTDILAAVIDREPDWSRLPTATPGSVRSLLRKCLQKNTRERLRDIGDARADLRPSQEASDVTTVAQQIPTRRSPRLLMGIGWFAAGAVVAAIAWSFSTLRPQTPAIANDPVRLVIALPPDVSLSFGRGASIAISPDGRQLVYAGTARDGKVRLYVRPLDRYESTVIAGTEEASNPFFSPDGRWVGFFAQDKLKKVLLDGGAPVAVVDIRQPRGETWDGDRILVTPTNSSGVVQIPANGGQPAPLTTLQTGEMSHRWPRVLRDGSVLFTIWNDTGWEPARIAAQRSGSTEHNIVVHGGGYAHYVHDGAVGRDYLIYARSEGLLAAPFDVANLRVTGQAVPIVDGVLTNLSGGAHFDVASTGTLAYVPGTLGEIERDFSWVTLDGNATSARRLRSGRFFSLSPDGTRLLRINTLGQRDVWIEDLERGTSTRLTNQPNNFTAIWSEDGQSVAFARGAPGVDIYRRRIDQSGVDEQLTTTGRAGSPTGFSPDGRTLVYTEIGDVSGMDVMVMTLPTPESPTPSMRPFVQTAFSENSGVFSPDGRWIAYQSNESGRFEVYIRAFPDGKQFEQISTAGGLEPRWSRNGQLFYRGTNGKMMMSPLKLTPQLEISKPQELFDARGYENDFGVAPDGKRLLMMPLDQTEQAARQVHVILNFVSELRARVQ